MRRALELAAKGRGLVEPNPMVGCVIARGAEIIGEGFHSRYGGPHAEVNALAVAGERAAGAAMYVTLEPCCHHGKTPPCTDAILAAGIREVVIAQLDPFPQVSGGGIAALRAAGLDVTVGVLTAEAERLNAPYLKLVRQARPWVIAKWAMTLDGHTATHTGASRWISNEASRAKVHELRGRVDAIIVGRGTATMDDPLLTARPAGPRVATRIVFDSQATLNLDSQLVRTAAEAPVLVAATASAPAERVEHLRKAGCEVFLCPDSTPRDRADALFAELGRRRMTNVWIEGGATLLGSLFDAGFVDEVHAFIAPKILGGAGPSGVRGAGVVDPAVAWCLDNPGIETLGGDVYVHGYVRRGAG